MAKKLSRSKPTLESRVAALELAVRRHTSAASPSATPALDELNVLRLLEARPSSLLAPGSHLAAGALLWAGLARFGERRFADVRYGSVPDILRADPRGLAAVLSAVASAPRIVLLRRLLAGNASRVELLEALSDASVGQLYHHIKELQAVGMISQPERGVFQVNPHRAIQVLALLGVAAAVAGETEGSRRE